MQLDRKKAKLRRSY